MGYAPLRYKRLIELLPQCKTAKEAMIKAGFSPITADRQTRRVLRSAFKYQIELTGMTEKQGLEKQQEAIKKTLMSDIIGISSPELMERLKWIALENDKDISSALKVLIPLVKEHGLNLSEDAPKVTVPILNLTVEKPNDGLTEPQKEVREI